MTDPGQASIDAFLAALQALGRPRVWSLVITILGDVAHPRGGWMAMGELQQIVTSLGIEPGALRTAMSRLTGDGWVERSKKGRNSWYRLSKAHRAEFLSASAAVYAAAGARHDGRWSLYVLPAGMAAETTGWRLRPGVLLAPAGNKTSPSAKDGAVAVTGEITHMPDWAAAIIAPPEQAERLNAFLMRLAGMTPDKAAQLSPDRAMTLRVLMIHEWRRLVLRHPSVPSTLAPKDWPEAACRAQVAALYPILFQLCEGQPSTGRFVDR